LCWSSRWSVACLACGWLMVGVRCLSVGVDVWVLLKRKAPPLMSSARRKLVHGARIRCKRCVKTEESINACFLLLKDRPTCCCSDRYESTIGCKGILVTSKRIISQHKHTTPTTNRALLQCAASVNLRLHAGITCPSNWFYARPWPMYT
jgi:hypothetical protein